MIIKSLKLNNFRQFTNDQVIEFSHDQNKKVTFIMAESGVGKTTLIQSFRWVLYGKCKYNKILNAEVADLMRPGRNEKVSVEVVINHNNKDYTIKREQIFTKINVRVDPSDSVLSVDYKNEEGISKQVKGRDAELIIKGIMHSDLFNYFFLEGENLTEVGEQMTKGRSASNNEFIKAIKGLLGFNFLYETVKHLDVVENEYNSEIAKNTTSQKLKETIENIQKLEKENEEKYSRNKTVEEEIKYNEGKREELSGKLLEFSDIENKQRRTKILNQELGALKIKIEDRKRILFRKFSQNGFYLVLSSLLDDAKESLKNADSIDKGIPGMNTEAIKFLLDNHLCICGEKLEEGSDHWKKLKDLESFLPPNNIGFEIETFNNEIKDIERQSKYFDEDFLRERKDLVEDIKNYDSKVEELDTLNKEIGGVREDIGLLKQQEQQYNQKIIDLNVEKRENTRIIDNNKAKIRELEAIKEIYQKQDEKTKMLQAYYIEANYLKTKIQRFIARKEKEKREKLTEAINSIFKDFYKEKVSFSLDSNYSVDIKIYDKETSDDFASGGQNVAAALAFIGAIIKLNSEKDVDPEFDDDDTSREKYPLVMDAPTSNFGMKQMQSFSDIIPEITDQVIVFINDKDGPILKNLMRSQIGSEWSLYKEEGDSFHTEIRKGGM